MLAVDDIPCAVMITDLQGHIVRLNREFLALVGAEEASWQGRSVDALLTPASRIFSQTHLFPTLHHAAVVREIYLHLVGADGEPVPVMVNAVRKRNEGVDTIIWAFFVARERSRFEAELIRARADAQSLAQRLAASNAQVEEQNRHLSELSLSDPLTGLKNRRALELAAQQWQLREGEGAAASLLMVDVDHFKRINDLHGHPEGDRALIAVARQLQASARGTDLVARYGGEEFVIWLPDADAQAAARVAQRVHEHIERVRTAAGHITVSVGLVSGPHEAAPDFLARLVKRADEAVYAAKSQGRNRTVTSP
ncbi:MAG: sensor domain-containing diguanylate cyclase [Hylemonella sp.]|nr:sensor domain-containing diguanylate cyclase [Hylemonella sp.]